MACTEQPDLDKRIRCQTAVWNAIQKEISTLRLIHWYDMFRKIYLSSSAPA